MPYIGNPIYQSAFVTDQFSGTGSQTAYTMSVAPAGTTNVLVVVSGVVQDPSTYGVVGNTLNFTTAPPSGTANISVRYLGVPVTGVTTTAYRTKTEFTATAGQTTFTPPSYTVGYIDVFRNGVLLGSADYTASNGTTVVLTTGATSGDLITTESFYVSSVLNAIPNTAGSVGTANIVTGVTLTTPTFTGTTTLPSGVANSFGLGLGTAVPSSGMGITFPATQSSSTDPNTLDDYEEGTWTPVLTFGGGSTGITYGSRTALYTKVGNTVYVAMDIVLTNKGSSTGSVWVTGLPFAYNSTLNNVYTMPCLLGTTATSVGTLVAGVYLSNLYVYYTYASGYTNLQNTAFSNTSELTICGTYLTQT